MKLLLILFTISIKLSLIKAGYVSNFINDEQNNLNMFSIYNCNSSIQEKTVRICNFDNIINIEFQRETFRNYINGWNTSTYIGEFDSNKDIMIVQSSNFKIFAQSYLFEINFNILLIDPIKDHIITPNNFLVNFKEPLYDIYKPII